MTCTHGYVRLQEPDAALGNGGLGRLASCFLDSMATLNYPAWGYGLRYRYGLFKQLITKDGQEEVAEDWLEVWSVYIMNICKFILDITIFMGFPVVTQVGNPWEIARNDIFYPVKFYGEVIEGPDGRKEWVGGENIIAVAYDVPIPGYKTKTTINLRLWSTKVSAEVFDLHAFNLGDHAKAYEAMKRAEKVCINLCPVFFWENSLIHLVLFVYYLSYRLAYCLFLDLDQICYVLYPGDDSYEGKTLRLKQQYTLCSASLQDIIERFERRSGESVNWEKFPGKVAVQMNDTHPTLCIPELIRILVDVKGLSWDEAWGITQRYLALLLLY